MATIRDIAELCGVSVMTVSNILNGKTDKASKDTVERVLSAAQSLGYEPNLYARELRQKNTRLIGVIAEDITLFTTPPIIEAVMAFCEENGYRVLVKNLRMYTRWKDNWYRNDKEIASVVGPAVRELKSLKAAGMIYIAGHSRDAEPFPEDPGIPAVLIYARSLSGTCTSVLIDDTGGARTMTELLIGKGCRRIGLLCGHPDNLHTIRRLEGYQKALAAAGIDCDPELVVYGNWDRAVAAEETQILLERKADAIFAMSDEMAGGVYDCLNRLGITPGEDLSVVGFDDHVISGFLHPALTTMRLPLARMGREGARNLLERIDSGEKECPVITCRCSLVERASIVNKE